MFRHTIAAEIQTQNEGFTTIADISLLANGGLAINSSRDNRFLLVSPTGEVSSPFKQEKGNPIVSVINSNDFIYAGDHRGNLYRSDVIGNVISTTPTDRRISGIKIDGNLVVASSGYSLLTADLEFNNLRKLPIPGFPITTFTAITMQEHQYVAAAGEASSDTFIQSKLAVWNDKGENIYAAAAAVMSASNNVGPNMIFGSELGTFVILRPEGNGITDITHNGHQTGGMNDRVNSIEAYGDSQFVSTSANGSVTVWNIDIQSNVTPVIEIKHDAEAFAASIVAGANSEPVIVSAGRDQVVRVTKLTGEEQSIYNQFAGRLTVCKSVQTERGIDIIVGDDTGKVYILGIDEANRVYSRI